jgi:hypothetical protein
MSCRKYRQNVGTAREYRYRIVRDGTGNTAELPIPAGCGTVLVPIPEKAAVPGRDGPLLILFAGGWVAEQKRKRQRSKVDVD